MSADILPHNAAPVDLSLAYIWDSHRRYAPLIGTIRNYGISVVPDDWVPFLIWDLGLEDVVPYVRDMRQALAEGPAWQARRGTDAGIAIGIGWVNSAGTVAPPDQRHDWWEFQVSFEQPASDIAQIQQLDGIIRLSKASEDELFRMFSPGRDWRPVRMDMHRYDEGLMDGYSGEALWDGGPLISFGWAGTFETDLAPFVTASTEITVTTAMSLFDGMRFDADHFGVRPRQIVEASAEVDVATDIVNLTDVWPEYWPTSWASAADHTAIPATGATPTPQAPVVSGPASTTAATPAVIGTAEPDARVEISVEAL